MRECNPSSAKTHWKGPKWTRRWVRLTTANTQKQQKKRICSLVCYYFVNLFAVEMGQVSFENIASSAFGVSSALLSLVALLSRSFHQPLLIRACEASRVYLLGPSHIDFRLSLVTRHIHIMPIQCNQHTFLPHSRSFFYDDFITQEKKKKKKREKSLKTDEIHRKNSCEQKWRGWEWRTRIQLRKCLKNIFILLAVCSHIFRQFPAFSRSSCANNARDDLEWRK